MSTELWQASLNPAGPNYQTWLEIFGSNQVPLKNPRDVKATLEGEGQADVYLLDIEALTLPQRARLWSKVAAKFGVPIYEVQAEVKKKGFPIRAADVIVSFDVRAFA
jgi:hypothetical protein